MPSSAAAGASRRGRRAPRPAGRAPGRGVSASTVEGTNTPFSTVLIVLRLTPTISASAAWVRPRSARSACSRLQSRSVIPERAPLEHAEADQRGDEADRHQDVDRVAPGDRLEQGHDVEQDRRRSWWRESRVRNASARLARVTSSSIRARTFLGRSHEAAGRQHQQQHDREHEPGADLHMIDSPRALFDARRQ